MSVNDCCVTDCVMRANPAVMAEVRMITIYHGGDRKFEMSEFIRTFGFHVK